MQVVRGSDVQARVKHEDAGQPSALGVKLRSGIGPEVWTVEWFGGGRKVQ